MRKIDLTGNRYGDLLVLKESPIRKNTKVCWECLCINCGNKCIRTGQDLKRGYTTSCGCEEHDNRSRARTKDLTGQKFGKLTVVERCKERETYGRTMWKCKCECGNETVVSGIHLTQGKIISCGCYKIYFGEEKIAKILSENGIPYERNSYVKYSDKNGSSRFYFDFLVNNEYYIEYDGIQHFKGWHRDEESLKIQQKRDKRKDNFCELAKIPLIRIPYTMYETMTIDDLILKNSNTEATYDSRE